MQVGCLLAGPMKVSVFLVQRQEKGLGRQEAGISACLHAAGHFSVRKVGAELFYPDMMLTSLEHPRKEEQDEQCKQLTVFGSDP